MSLFETTNETAEPFKMATESEAMLNCFAPIKTRNRSIDQYSNVGTVIKQRLLLRRAKENSARLIPLLG